MGGHTQMWGYTQMYRCLGYLIKRNVLQEIDTAANKFNFRKLAPFSSVNFVLAFTSTQQNCYIQRSWPEAVHFEANKWSTNFVDVWVLPKPA